MLQTSKNILTILAKKARNYEIKRSFESLLSYESEMPRDDVIANLEYKLEEYGRWRYITLNTAILIFTYDNVEIKSPAIGRMFSGSTVYGNLNYSPRWNTFYLDSITEDTLLGKYTLFGNKVGKTWGYYIKLDLKNYKTAWEIK